MARNRKHTATVPSTQSINMLPFIYDERGIGIGYKMLKHSATNVKYIISMLICDNRDRQSQASLVP
ncbi:hypothetical protein C0Q70_13602 [Pomacea canaliculata]|uniref:Uncharacterized protein n=1 Tax=Pomacea canaliculata TaxID=400727 RepID=A0A2T7NXN5_POMCA|nr:hypothetical protein C0Q70_13602 [Pomacea canaliculata]